MRQRQALIWGVVCILGFMASRLLVLEAMPPFIDEAYVLDMGRTMMETSPFYRAEEGRTLAAWYWLGLQAPYQAPFWVARYANVLVAALGLGAALGMARQAGGLPALLTTAALLTFSRFHTFFDSFAGTESLLAGFVLVSVALTHRLRRRVRYTDAALAGAALFVACGMKISALPFVVVPALGVLTLPGVTVRQRVMWGAVAYGSFGALFGGFVGVMMWRGYQPLHHLLRASGGGADLVARTQDIFNAYATYTGAALGGLLLVLAVYLAFRRRFFLLSVLVVPAGVLWLSGGYFTRYLYPHLSVLMVCAAVAAGLTRRRIVPLALAAVALVGWVPFVWQFVAGDPAGLDIPAAGLRGALRRGRLRCGAGGGDRYPRGGAAGARNRAAV